MLQHVTYEWRNKVTCPYRKAFIAAKKWLASCRHRDEQARIHHSLFPIHLKNVKSEWSYECTSKRINIFGRDKMLLGHSIVSLTVNTPCHLQLCTVLKRWVRTKYTCSYHVDPYPYVLLFCQVLMAVIGTLRKHSR